MSGRSRGAPSQSYIDENWPFQVEIELEEGGTPGTTESYFEWWLTSRDGHRGASKGIHHKRACFRREIDADAFAQAFRLMNARRDDPKRRR